MPVVDPTGQMVGIVSRRDLLRMHTRSDQDIRDDVVDGVLMRTWEFDDVRLSRSHGFTFGEPDDLLMPEQD